MTLEDYLVEGLDEIRDEVVALKEFFDPSVTQPNAQVSSKVSPKKVSQAQSMARHGIYSKPRVLNHMDAEGHYLGAGLELGDDSAIDNFDPNSYGDSSDTLSGSGVSKTPSLSNANSNLHLPSPISGELSLTRLILNAFEKQIGDEDRYFGLGGGIF